MDKYLYPKFQTDSIEFKSCIKLWENLVDEMSKINKRFEKWQSWLQIRFLIDGVIEEDPLVFSLYDPKDSKGFSIQQLDIDYNTPPMMYCHLRFFGEGHLKKPITHLHIGCELTQNHKEEVKMLLEKWINPNTTIVDMSSFLKGKKMDGDYEKVLNEIGHREGNGIKS